MQKNLSKKKYFEALFSNEEIALAPATILLEKLAILPSKLYRYRPINDFLKDILIKDIAYLSPAHDFNDPYDSGLTLNYTKNFSAKMKETIIEEFCKKTLHLFDDKDFHQYSNEINTLLEEVPLEHFGFILGGAFSQDKLKKENNIERLENKIQIMVDDLSESYTEYLAKLNALYQSSVYAVCFTETNDNILMWSHYAQNHQGICIEYDFSTLEFTSKILNRLSPVKYTNKLFDMEDYPDKNPIEKTTLASLSKFDCWAYEKEWRIISHLKEEQRFQLNKPTAIIFGTKTSDKHKEWISKICEERGISIKQAELDRREYKLLIEEKPIEKMAHLLE